MLFRVIRIFKNAMKTNPKKESNVTSSTSENSKIDKSDIIDAEFEELPVKEPEKESSSEDK